MVNARPLTISHGSNRIPNGLASGTASILIRVILGLFILNSAGAQRIASADSEPPLNVLFLLVDDLGWTDLACFGSDFYETPSIDRLAAGGMRFRQAYAAAPVCSPTRAAILTGQFPARLNMTIWHEGSVRGGPENERLRDAQTRANLPLEIETLAESFHAAGYLTAHIGKWHLGTAAYYPEAQGYDINVGGTFWGAPSTFFFPFKGPWSDNDPQLRYVPGLGWGQPEDYLTDRLTDQAIDVIQRAGQRPFFLSMWFYSVHSPIEAPAFQVKHYRAKTPTSGHRDPHYAAMVSQLDQNVGRILEALDRTGQRDRTIVILTSDNGGVDFPVRSITPTSNDPLRSGKGTLYEGGIRVPLIVDWPSRTQPGTSTEVMVSSQDFLPTLVEGLGLPVDRDQPIDGISWLPLLTDHDQPLNRDTLYWHYPHYYSRMKPASALRRGDWKLIHYYEDERLELYRLDEDIAERHNRAESETSVAKLLKADLDRWRVHVAAQSPQPNPNYRPNRP